MAWCTNTDPDDFFLKSGEPDMDTLLYWITRMQPIISIDSSQETIIVFGNRCGVEGDTTYVGTSTVIGIKSGEILLYGILGRDEQALLVVDTDAEPYAKLRLQNHEAVMTEDEREDTTHQEPNEQIQSSRQARNAGGVPPTSGTAVNQPLPSGYMGHVIDNVTVTRGTSRDQPASDAWQEPSRRPREYPTAGPFRVDGSSVGIPSSSSHVSYPQLTQSHVAIPATQHPDMEEMRPTMSEGGYANRLDEFSESASNSLISDAESESDEDGWAPRTQESQTYGRQHVLSKEERYKAGTEREHRNQHHADRKHPTTNRPQAGTGDPSAEETESESSLVQRISAFAMQNEVLPSSTSENFNEEDIYKYVHGKNLTSEHHIRYHTHLLKAKRVRQGLPENDEHEEEDDGEDNDGDKVAVENQYILAGNQDQTPFKPQSPHVIDFDSPDGVDLPILIPASDNRVRVGINAQSEATAARITKTRVDSWHEYPAEPTPIADTPMSDMTQFSHTRTRRRQERLPPINTTAFRGQIQNQSQVRYAEEPDSTPTVAGIARMRPSKFVSDPKEVRTEEYGHGVSQRNMEALGRSRAKENLVPLQDPSRRPKAASKQVPPLRLVPREAPKEKERAREVRERTRRMSPRTPRQVARNREPDMTRTREKARDNKGHDNKGRKTPVPMVLVYEGQGEEMPFPYQR